MVGIIYKFTILVKYKFYGNKPFYIGQHWCKKSKKDFLKYNYRYCGSGYIWNDFLKKLKTEYPSCWRKLIKREILFSLNKDDKPLLSKMEEYYIKKERACYKNKNGGCNTEVLVPLVNPFFDKNRCERQRELKNKLFSSKKGDEVRKKMSDSHYNCVGENNPMYGSQASQLEISRLALAGDPAAGQTKETAEGEERDYNKPLKKLAEVKKFMEEIGYNGSLSKTKTTEDGRKFVKYYASGNITPNIYFGETTPRDILQQFYLYDNIMEVYIPADIWAEFEQEDAERKESKDNYWANEREKAKDILTQANIPFVDVIDSEVGIRVVFTDKKNENGNYTEYMDLSDTEQLQEDIESVREEAESYKQPKQETPKQESTEPKEPKRLISDEQMDELKERLRKKLRGQLTAA